jgi:hypothetical protein
MKAAVASLLGGVRARKALMAEIEIRRENTEGYEPSLTD